MGEALRWYACLRDGEVRKRKRNVNGNYYNNNNNDDDDNDGGLGWRRREEGHCWV